MKNSCRLLAVFFMIAFAFSCTSISSHIISHQYVVETLVHPNGLDLNQVTVINILLDSQIYDEYLPTNYYHDSTVAFDLSSDIVVENVSDSSADFSTEQNVSDSSADFSTVQNILDSSTDMTTDTQTVVKRSPFSKEEIKRKTELNNKKFQTYQFATCLRDYVETFYHNRGLQKPKVNILTKPRNFFGYEMTIAIKSLEIDLTSDWTDVTRDYDTTDDKIIFYHYNIGFSRAVKVAISAELLRFDEAKYCLELTDDVSYTVKSNDCIERKYKSVEKALATDEKMNKTENFADRCIRQIDKKMLYRGAIDKIFREIFGKALVATSKDVVYFKYGKGEQFNHAQACLRHGRYDEALAVWQEIFDEPTNPTFARGVAAYNIGMCKTLERDYEAAAMYFAISEDLRDDGLQDLERF